MKYPLFKVFILCVLLPPFLYFISIFYLERWCNQTYLEEIRDVYIGDARPLFEGTISVKNAVSKNISTYVREQWFVKAGLKLDVVVTTKKGTILYPAVFENPASTVSPPDPMKVAAENYEILNDGLAVHVKSEILYYKPLSLFILFSYIGISIVLMAVFAGKSFQKTKKAEMEKIQMINRLIDREKRSLDILKTLGKKRDELNSRYGDLKEVYEQEKLQASKNEDGMLDEIVKLEEELKRNIDLQQEQQEEIERLKAEIEKFEKGSQRGKGRSKKGADSAARRFKAIYKNISMNKKALDGFTALPEDMKIKCEEVIHQLNENPDQVHIKRKVFSKKSRETVLEVLFAYKGRLYFRRITEQQVEVLTVGTKNTQLKDLEFIDSL